MFRLQLLQNWGHIASRENISGQEQNGQTIDGGYGSPRDHVRRTGPNRGGAGKRSQTVAHLGKSQGRVNHGLFIAGEIVAKVLGLPQGLANTPNVTVSKDSPNPGKKGSLTPITFHILIL